MKYFFVLILAMVFDLYPHAIAAQVKTPVLNFEKKGWDGQPMLLGHCSASVFNNEPYNSWFQKNYVAHQIDSLTLLELKPLLKKKKIDIFLGTWCGDSKWEFPRMLKILLAANFDTTNLSIVCVSNEAEMYKKSPQGEEIGRNIQRVPTLIVYEKNKEIGRIIESPIISLEKDLLKILRKEGYIPHFSTLKE
jgi:thiol-disulfide isomerase/thioredoxin